MNPNDYEDEKDSGNNDFIMSPFNDNYKNFDEFERDHILRQQKMIDEMENIKKEGISTMEQFLYKSEGEEEDKQSFGSLRMSNKEIDFDPQVNYYS